MVSLKALKNEMIERHLKGRGISDARVLEAMAAVPREDFIPEKLQDLAYDDRPLPIGENQTISQPFIVAFMTQELDLSPEARVLEIGTGSGYAAAVLGQIAARVFTIERHQKLASAAREKLKPWKNVTVVDGDGSVGLLHEAPFDAIIVTAAGPKVPETLKQQLKVGGRLVMPVGSNKMFQRLLKIVRQGPDDFLETDLGGVAFVPLIGDEGF